jgi:protein-tyrosine phosphatase
MQIPYRNLNGIVLSAAFAAAVLLSGCSARVSTGYRVHDGYYNDEHVWDNNEVMFYGRWEDETHRRHEDFRHRNEKEQKDYWNWRHNQH